jgi:hypothetical protein
MKISVRSYRPLRALREEQAIQYEYTYIFNGSRFDEEDFKQKLILKLRTLKSISAVQAIPEAVDVIVYGLKEGAQVRGIANFQLGDVDLIIRAKKTIDHSPDGDEEIDRD